MQVRRRNPDLGSCKWLIASSNHLLQEILMPKSEIRLAKASAVFRMLHQKVRGWNELLSLTTRLAVYRAVGLTSLLQASRTWTIWSTQAKQPNDNRFHVSCLRLLHFSGQYKLHVPSAQYPHLHSTRTGRSSEYQTVDC